ncbi:MAG: hypothetical protein QOJ55_2402 [Solirubrobacteraceae bacterium]|nr:hypothetical protein [Solirubrobacteraceae bacterium]
MHSQPSRSVSERSRRTRFLVGLLTTVGLLAFAVPASASSLFVTVTPTVVRINHQFTLKVRGTSDGPLTPDGSRQAVQVWSQKASTSCAATSSLENARTYSSTRLRTYINPGPFLFTSHVNARALGGRRICAYLDYGPNTSPQLRAGARYVVKLPRCTRFRRHNCSRT